ncbi:MAG: thiamine pyrophosphate-binding protein, partial [Candidatus Dormibacteria bacterium]
MNTAERLVQTLEQLQVDTFFGLPGSTEAALLEALRQSSKIRYVLGLHEGVVVAMADGYARASGRVGVASLHTTVGTMNGLSQLYNSARDAVPVLLTAGHKDRTVLAEDGFCAIPDLASLARQFAKYSWQSLSSEQVPADLARAYAAALTPPRGAAYLALPEDLLAAPSPEEAAPLPLAGRLEAEGAPDPELVGELARRLLSAQRPRLVLGGLAAPASAEAQRLAEAVGMGVLANDLTELSCLSYPTDDSHYLGVWGEEPAALEGCDLLLAVGCRVSFPFSARRRAQLPPGATLVQIHPDPAQLARRQATDLGIAGDPGRWLRALARAGAQLAPGDEGPGRRAAELRELRTGRLESVAAELQAVAGAQPLAVADLAQRLAQVLPEGTIV